MDIGENTRGERGGRAGRGVRLGKKEDMDEYLNSWEDRLFIQDALEETEEKE